MKDKTCQLKNILPFLDEKIKFKKIIESKNITDTERDQFPKQNPATFFLQLLLEINYLENFATYKNVTHGKYDEYKNVRVQNKMRKEVPYQKLYSFKPQ